MSLYALMAAGLLWAGSIAAAGWWAYGAGQNAEIATQAREDRASAVATEAAANAAATAISKIEVRNVTVTKALEREVLTREVFRDCRSGMDAVRLLNSTPSVAPAASAPGDSKLPAPSAPG